MCITKVPWLQCTSYSHSGVGQWSTCETWKKNTHPLSPFARKETESSSAAKLSEKTFKGQVAPFQTYLNFGTGRWRIFSGMPGPIDLKFSGAILGITGCFLARGLLEMCMIPFNIHYSDLKTAISLVFWQYSIFRFRSSSALTMVQFRVWFALVTLPCQNFTCSDWFTWKYLDLLMGRYK